MEKIRAAKLHTGWQLSSAALAASSACLVVAALALIIWAAISPPADYLAGEPLPAPAKRVSEKAEPRIPPAASHRRQPDETFVAAKVLSTHRSAPVRTWPRQKPRRLSQGKPVTKTIDLNAEWLSPDIRQSFAAAADFTGGREAIFTPVAPPFDPLREDPALHRDETLLVIDRGETLAAALMRAGLEEAQAGEAANALNSLWPLRKLRAGQEFALRLADGPAPDAPVNLDELILKTAPGKFISVAGKDGGFTATAHETPLTRRYAAVRGEISDSLFASAARQGAPREVTAKLANLFLYDLDFQRQIWAGDRFEAVYEVWYDDQGTAVSYGDVVYGQLSWKGGASRKGYFRYLVDGKPDWFDQAGESARRLLMKTPIEGARITSGFGRRRHPVLGYTKKHKGVDFGAARGTPVMAAGNGTVEYAARFGSFGNYVKIRHANGYETAYAHLKGFGAGVKKGKTVRQGQIIGYVGTTGRSTGPHLHYEVLKEGTQINPMNLKVATGRKLEESDLAAFLDERDWINSLRIPEPPVVLAKAE